MKAYSQEHKKEIKAYNKAYRQEHKEEIKACNKAYRQKHREEDLTRHKAYYQEYKKEAKAYRKTYRQKHREEILAHRFKNRYRYRALTTLWDWGMSDKKELLPSLIMHKKIREVIYGKVGDERKNSARD